MTGLDTQVDALISQMNPAFSSLCSSDAIAFLLGSSNHRSGCLTGLALGSTFSARSMRPGEDFPALTEELDERTFLCGVQVYRYGGGFVRVHRVDLDFL
jgi:hypothetical protein